MFNYKGTVLLLSEMKLVLSAPGKTANVRIDLFILECSVSTHRITENFKVGSSDQKSSEKRCGDIPQQTENAKKSSTKDVLDQGKIKQSISLS